MNEEMTLDERVAKGSQWLDQKQPGWRQKINIDTLDVESMYNCVLGQVFGSFSHAIHDCGIPLSILDWGFCCPIKYSRDKSVVSQAFGKLTAAWKKVLS